LLIDPDDMIANSFMWALAQTENEYDRSVIIASYKVLADNGGTIARHKLSTLLGK
jgi:hypothetical protein